LIFIQLGSIFVAIGLEEFLIPNKLLDGGIVGISIILNLLFNIPLGILLILLNLPFIVIALKKINKKFIYSTIYAVISLSIWVSIFHPIPELTNDIFLSSIFGGIFIGIGLGTIIKNDACLDGTEIVSIILNKKLSFSVGEIIMFINIMIFAFASIILGINKALYSIVAYIIAYKIIDFIILGIDHSLSLFIVTEKPNEISEKIFEEFKTSVTILKGMGGYTKLEIDILYLIISRFELQKAKSLILDIDKNAFITIHNVHELIRRKTIE